MKIIETQPYLTDCSICNRFKVHTDYQNFNEIPENTTKAFLCDSCKSRDRSADLGANIQRKHVYYKSCSHKDAPYNTLPVITDLIIIEGGKKRRTTAQCLNCSG